MLIIAMLFTLSLAQHHSGMPFDQDAVTHHFRLQPKGGAIEVTVKEGADPATLELVRQHLRSIAGEFAKGDFGNPMATHGEVPPGVTEMARRKDAIRYRYEEMARGARVSITTEDGRALAAVHEFLRYQITEHKTGDPTSVKDDKRSIRP